MAAAGGILVPAAGPFCGATSMPRGAGMSASSQGLCPTPPTIAWSSKRSSRASRRCETLPGRALYRLAYVLTRLNGGRARTHHDVVARLLAAAHPITSPPRCAWPCRASRQHRVDAFAQQAASTGVGRGRRRRGLTCHRAATARGGDRAFRAQRQDASEAPRRPGQPRGEAWAGVPSDRHGDRWGPHGSAGVGPTRARPGSRRLWRVSPVPWTAEEDDGRGPADVGDGR